MDPLWYVQSVCRLYETILSGAGECECAEGLLNFAANGYIMNAEKKHKWVLFVSSIEKL
jgi:hypothetical protein